MTIPVPGFSERVFEFSFNAEYANRNCAVLAGVPDIPTQNKEKSLGYDVKFQLQQRGGPVHAVALQHKVSRYVDRIGPKSGHFWSATGGPYYGFRLDVDQFNLLEKLSSSKTPGIEFHFCAPRFADRLSMNNHFMATTVEANSIWISVADAGQINPDEPHSIIYSEDGSRAFLFSQNPVELKVLDHQSRQVHRKRRDAVPLDNVEKIYNEVFEAIQTSWSDRIGRARETKLEGTFALPSESPRRVAATAANLAELLAEYVGASVLIEVAK